MPTTALLVPVLDERPTVDAVVTLVRDCLAAGAVDRAVVLDGGSSDGGPDALRAAGIEVLDVVTLPPGTDVRGKGDSVRRGTDAIAADRYVLVDGDVRGIGVAEVAALLDALGQPGVHLAKSSFHRRQRDGQTEVELGGRVTELLARPLLARFAPDLEHVREPLSGQQAITRDALDTLPVISGYGLEIGLLLAVRARFGAAAIVDVPIPPLSHDRKDDRSLVPMAHQVLAALAWGLGLTATGTIGTDTEPGTGLLVLPPRP